VAISVTGFFQWPLFIEHATAPRFFRGGREHRDVDGGLVVIEGFPVRAAPSEMSEASPSSGPVSPAILGVGRLDFPQYLTRRRVPRFVTSPKRVR